MIAYNDAQPTAVTSHAERSPAGRESRRMRLLKRTGLFGSNMDGIKIGRATALEDLAEAFALVHDVFVAQGYIEPSPSGLRVRAYEALPESATFVAKNDEGVVGVTSLVIDSQRLGLPSDKVLGKEIDQLRRAGRKVCEVTNWAVSEGYRNSGILTELMRCSFAHAVLAGYDDLIGAVSPGHARFFNLLGFETMGPVRSYSSKIHDPVVLVRMDLAGIDQRVSRIRDEAGDDEAFLKRYYVDDNGYHAYVSGWSELAESLFDDAASLRELFVDRADLLSACDPDELLVICEAWGPGIFNEVFAGAYSPAGTTQRPLSHRAVQQEMALAG